MKLFAFACQSPIDHGSPTYACMACKYFLHKQCAECPTNEVTHFSHPSYSLTLHLDHEKLISCKCCKRKACSFIFSCSSNECYWNVCIECYLLPKHLNRDQYIFHSHHPDLTLVNMISTANNNIKQAELTCNLCHVSFKSSSPHFKCSACDFVVDADCARNPSITFEEKSYFRHFSHPHPMMLVDKKEDNGDRGGVDEIFFGCELSCRSSPYYSCTKCTYFLHKCCALLPLRIKHPLHEDRLSLYLHTQVYQVQKSTFVFCVFGNSIEASFLDVATNLASSIFVGDAFLRDQGLSITNIFFALWRKYII